MTTPTTHTRVAASDGVELFVQSWGTGPIPILCIPGAANVGDWYGPMGELLEDVATTYAFDFRAVGRSAPSSDISVPRLAEDVLDIVRAMGLDQPVLVGQSMGGIVLQELLTTHPDVAGAAVLVTTGIAAPDPDMVAKYRAGELDHPVAAVAHLEPGERIRLVGPAHFSSEFVASPRFEEWVSWQTRLAASADVLRAYLDAALDYTVGDGLRGVALATLVLGGTADQVAPVEGSKELASAIPGADLALLDDGQHALLYEHPAWCADRIREFLQSLPSQGRTHV